LTNTSQKPKTRKGTKRKKPQIKGIATLDDLLKHLHIQTWDTLIVGDGSGTGWKQGAGWASVLIDQSSGARKLFYGAMNTGTVTLGEMFPYLHALSWYAGRDGPGRNRRQEVQQLGRDMQVHIVTDSQTVATCGNNPASRRSHRELWKAFDEYRSNGFALQFHFVARDVINLNVLVDEISRQARKDMEETYSTAMETLCKRYPGLPEDATIYDFN